MRVLFTCHSALTARRWQICNELGEEGTSLGFLYPAQGLLCLRWGYGDE